MVFMAIVMGLGLLFYILLGFRVQVRGQVDDCRDEGFQCGLGFRVQVVLFRGRVDD